MNFTYKDLPAYIQYKDQTHKTLVINLSDVQWWKEFDILEKNCEIDEVDLKEYVDKNKVVINTPMVNEVPLPVPTTHWLHKEVEEYETPIKPLVNEIPDINILVDAIKRALQWSTKKGQLSTVDPTAIVYNAIYQLTGDIVFLNNKEILINQTLNVSENEEGVRFNRYVIDYRNSDTNHQVVSFMCYAPNTLLAIEQFKFEKKASVDQIVEVNQLNKVSIDHFNTDLVCYAIKYRHLHESQIKTRYYYTNHVDKEDIKNSFKSEVEDVFIYSVLKVVGNSRT